MSLRLSKRIAIQDAIASGLVHEIGRCVGEAPIVATPALCEDLACAGADESVTEALARIALGARAAVEAETIRTGEFAAPRAGVRLSIRRAGDGRHVPVLAIVPRGRGRYVLMLDGE